jgi:hypothetical protein
VLPADVNSPQYNNGQGVVFYFLNSVQLNNTVLKALYGLDRDGDILVINPSTGVGSLVGNIGTGGTELAYDNLTGRAWVQKNSEDKIFEIDILTGSALTLPVNDGGHFSGMAFVDGILYGCYSTGGGSSPSTLATLNPVTGVSTDIGLTGISRPMSGLAWDGFGNMYAVSGGFSAPSFYKINLLTGTATLIGSTGVASLGSLRFGSNGTLYAGATFTDSNLYTINILTGTATLVGDTGFENITGLALV